MPPFKLKPVLALHSKSFQATPRITAIQRTLTGTAKNNTIIEPRESPSHPSPLILPNTSSSTSTRLDNPAPASQTTRFNTLLNDLTSFLTTSSKPHLPTLTTLLRNYTSHAPDWAPYAHSNPSKQYTRNLVTEVPGIFNLLLLVWTPGMRSPVHDHAGSHCLMKVLMGRLREVRYAMPGEGPVEVGRDGREEGKGLTEIQRTDFREGKVAYISDRLGLHEILNPDPTEYAVSLHLYTPPNAAMYGCHVYDAATGQSRHVMQGAYDSVRGVAGGA